MSGKLTGAGILTIALAVGLLVYYMQVFYYYETLPAEGEVVELTMANGATAPIAAEDIRAIDANSSPIRYRACFTTPLPLDVLSEAYLPYEAAEPLTAPSWFDCFDAPAIGAALEQGTARAFLGTKNITRGVDRVVAIFPDGRGYVWHQLNDCGEKTYDGTPIDDDCPPEETE
jgi:hypothetical protein